MRTRRTFLKEISIGATVVSLYPSVLKASENKTKKVVGNNKYDLLIYGATPGGIVCAVRAAREGLKILLVNYFQHIGGLLTNGLGVWDTLYEGRRSPIYDELRQSVFDYYKEKYGTESAQYKDALPGETGHSNGTFEPKVIELLINNLISNEKNIELLTGYYPTKVNVQEGLIKSLEFTNTANDLRITLEATIYADCTYEGDLLPLSGVPYRLGRESRSEFNEPHAGKIFMCNLNEIQYDKGLDLRHFGTHEAIIYPESTGEGDSNVQAFNMRTVLSSDPENRIEITKPNDYDRNKVKDLEYVATIRLPNNKISWNRPQLVGIHQQYIDGEWVTRNKVIEEHKKAVLNMLYFLQNDSSVPKNVQDYWKKFGLPKDEFTDNGYMPYEIYVREGRRLVGEYVVTEYDLMPALGQKRTPIKYDSIAVTDWYMDSHACTTERTRDSMDEGRMMLYYDTFPGQIPFRSLYNKKITNLLVPVCLSCTHVAWGAIRLEATWMNVAESAAIAATMSINEKKWLDVIDIDRLQIELVEKRIMIGFFNNFNINSESPLSPAVQYFSAKGFFKDYEVKADDSIDEITAVMWIENCRSVIDKTYRLIETVSKLHTPASSVSSEEFNKIMQQKGFKVGINASSKSLFRGQVIEFLYQLIKPHLV